ncbi:SDR family oxidoreductase [Denitrobaculum tricleocarpae]|uniref:SDR family oxidoreductase n=1 Tax=Denitrobaculum tricleocarpae TaxID=2591009 RepID=A0A545U266_9PROT|nr:SDR family oxidoreductase [Denitrobaculum tricleocarpae]TQV83572.1 SDR family oxidoreductase [Denitrobaculum tricleocarpae]
MNKQQQKRHRANYPRSVLITGAAKRIGRALALDFAAQGWTVAAHYRSSSAEADSLIAEIAATGGKAHAFQADLTQEADVQALVPSVVEAVGPLGCLINNASTFERDSIETASRESWDQHIEPNLRAPLVLTQSFAKALKDAVEPARDGAPAPLNGVVINMIDQRVWNPTPQYLSYALSKAGLWAMTKSLALELAPRIRVNGIGPGPALANARQSKEDFDAQCAAMPLGIGTSPEEICAAARFIISALSMTGQMIALDGGEHLGWAQAPQDHQFLD